MFTLKFIGSDIILIFSSACVFTKYFHVFLLQSILCAFYQCHETAVSWKEKKKEKKYSRKELTSLCYQYINVCTYFLHENLQSTYINFFRSLLEDLEHQSRWREVDYLDDTAEGDQNFLTPYRLVSLARELCSTGD